MKKAILLVATLATISLARAQSFAALENYSFGWYIQYMDNFVELKNGDILTCTRLYDIDPTGIYNYSTDLGYCFLKLDREHLAIMDSVFLPDNGVTSYLLEPHPNNDGYIFIHQSYDSLMESNFLKIRNFNEDLVFDDSNEISVPLIDTVIGGTDYFLLEENSFVMMHKRHNDSSIFQRFSLDGTLMDRVVYPDSTCSFWESRGMKIWNDTPREYVLTGYTPSPKHCTFYVLDSLLHLKESIELDESSHPPYRWEANANNKMESIDDSTYLLATVFERGTPNSISYQRGIQVTKRDKATHANLKTVYFKLHVAESGVLASSPYVVDIKQTKDRYIYLAYGDLSGLNRFSVVLLDTDLNVLWQQYYLNLDDWDYMYRMKVLETGVAMVGYDPTGTKVFALLVNNDYDGLDEQSGIVVRPYAFWPNPAKDFLNLEYSPDVTPKKIDLYDLQGRLVRRQTTALESINMEGLAAGTYMMRVTLQGGKVFSDKVVKE